jgi:cytochrome c-type biogenesis protein CcmH/NrfF
MSESRRQLLSIGVFFIVAVVAILLYAAKVIGGWLNIFPTILLLFGVWLLALGAMRAQKSQKYEQTAFGTIEMGVLLMALGGAWLLFSVNWLYSLALLLLVLGAIAIVAALRRKSP